MNRACFLTTIANPEPLNWGLKLEKIATPMVLLCSRDMAEALKAQSVPPHVSIVISELPQTPSLGDKLTWLRDACRVGYQNADSYYWIDARLVYVYDMHLNGTHHSVSLATVEFAPDGAGCQLRFTEQVVFVDGTKSHEGTAAREGGTAAHLDRIGAAIG